MDLKISRESVVQPCRIIRIRPILSRFLFDRGMYARRARRRAQEELRQQQQQGIIVTVGPDEGESPQVPSPALTGPHQQQAGPNPPCGPLHLEEVVLSSVCLPSLHTASDPSSSDALPAEHHLTVGDLTKAFLSETKHVLKETPEAAAEAAGASSAIYMSCL